MADWAIFNSNAASEICSRLATSATYPTLHLTLIITVWLSIVLIFR